MKSSEKHFCVLFGENHQEVWISDMREEEDRAQKILTMDDLDNLASLQCPHIHLVLSEGNEVLDIDEEKEFYELSIVEFGNGYRVDTVATVGKKDKKKLALLIARFVHDAEEEGIKLCILAMDRKHHTLLKGAQNFKSLFAWAKRKMNQGGHRD